MKSVIQQALRALPSVSSLLANPRITELAQPIDSAVVADIARRQLDVARTAILGGATSAADTVVDDICRELRVIAGAETDIVINGTGVVIQTNLGRAPVSAKTAEAMRAAATNYVALETDLVTGERGGRGHVVSSMMRALTGAERTLVVNNNASAVLLTLTALASGREVVVSRGEAVEIGGGFRIPAVLAQSGARLVEVGTTNRTYVSDYRDAITDQTAALLRVHHSNFVLVGFTASVPADELARLAHESGVLAIEDAGSGCLLNTEAFGLIHEPTLRESIEAGVDVVCASGDKLLGGPQAGLILGRADLVGRIERHPLARALRADKTFLAGIAATLRHYAMGEARECVPVWWSISREQPWLRRRAMRWKRRLDDPRVEIVRSEAVVGGGSLPGMTLPSWSLAIDPTPNPVDRLAQQLRTGHPAVVPRVADGRVLIDARTVLPDQDDDLLAAIRAALS